MNKENLKSINDASLRQKAEEQLKIKHAKKAAPLTEADTLKLLHELEVYQIELEMQNEELRLAKEKAEDAAKQYADLYEEIYDFAPAGYFNLDFDGTICKLNLSGATLLGEERSGLANNKFEQFVSPDTLPVFRDFLRKVFKTNSKQTCEVRLTMHGKPTNVVLIEGISSEENQKCILTATDITERKQAEKSIRTLSKAVEQSPSSIIITDAEGDIRFVNAKFASFMQYSLDDVKGKKPRIFNSGHNPQEVHEVMWETLRSGNIWHGESKNRKKDGTLFWEHAAISPLHDDNGAISNYILIMEDITENKKTLDDLIAAKEKAEESDHLKTAFLHNISHEIRTPMNVIVSSSNFLKNPDLLPEKRKHFTDMLMQSTTQLLSSVNNIINIATFETGQEKILEKEINLNSILRILHQQFISIAQNRNISLQFKTGLSDIDSEILTDETKLIEILTNIINNALKFTKQGHVNFGYNLVETQDAVSQLEFYVEDTGIGIPPEFHNDIFKLFRQVERTVARNFGGSGLGLSISKAYVDLLGGKIWLRSEPGKGSAFYFTIPYKKVNQPVLPNKEPSSELRIEIEKPKTLLIAEDEDANFILLEEILSELSMNIIRANNGIEAVDICKSNQAIDLVLMDIKMPEMDGYEATRKIKEFSPNLPIIVQTAYTTAVDKNKAFASGCSDFIGKPINLNLLLTKINEQLYKKR